MMLMPITVHRVYGVHTVLTEIGKNTSIQRQLVTPQHLESHTRSYRVNTACSPDPAPV
jgi:hypothetical protein